METWTPQALSPQLYKCAIQASGNGFLSNKDVIMQRNKVGYERDWFWGVFQVINMSAQFSQREFTFLNA